MATFTEANIAEIENRIGAAMALTKTEIGMVLENGRLQVEEAKALLAAHVASISAHAKELEINDGRVNKLVELLNEKEIQLRDLNAGVMDFAERQDAQAVAAGEKTAEQDAQAASQAAGLERLTAQTEEALIRLNQALQGIDAKLDTAVTECKTGAINEIEVMRKQMYTYSVGAQAEIKQIVDHLKTGQAVGGKGFGTDAGKGSEGSFGKGVDRKELAVWKPRVY